jgi:flagellar motility protein MotE (MotC chaperone)
MADEMEEVLEEPSVDKKAEKKAEKARKKEAKKKAKAEKKNDSLESEDETIGGKIVIFFVTLIIILIWLAIIALLIKWDVGGFGSGVLTPLLKDVPYVNRILPDSAMEELSTEDSAYAFDTMDDAVAYIKQLELQLADAQNNSSQDASYIAELEAQAAELAEYKQEEAAFEAEKEKFYEEVVFSDSAPDIDEYKAYYESIDPTNAEMIYRQVVEQTAVDEELEDYVKAYSSMKPKEAAAIFDTMTDNLKLVAEILENMDAQSRADILGKMDADTAAKVTEIMKPSE